MRVFRYLLGATLVMWAAGAFGQAVTINGVITDSDGNNWDDGYWSATLVSPNGDPMYNGAPLSTANFTGALDSNGNMTSTGQFYANGTITPTGSFYEINMCSATTAPCSKFNLQVVDGPSFVTAINAALTAPRFPAFVGALGYSDAELMLTPIVGARYFNSNTATFRYWDGTQFVDEGGGSPYDPTNVAITGGSIANVTQTGGTINGTAIGNTTPSLGYFTQLGATNILINCTVGTGGVTANHLVAYIAGTGMCANALVSATNVIGIAQLTVSSGGTSRVSQIGNFTCLSQGNWTIGDLLTSSASVAGACTDTGLSNTALIPNTTEIVGKALTACTSGSTCQVNNIGPGHFGRLIITAALTSGTIDGTTIGATTPAAGSFTTLTVTANGAASISTALDTGTWYAGGTGTTTVPKWLIQPAGTTAVTTWSTAGTALGINAASGFTGNFLDFRINGGASLFTVTPTGLVSSVFVMQAADGFRTSGSSGGLFELNNGGANPIYMTSSGAGIVNFGTTDGGTNATLVAGGLTLGATPVLPNLTSTTPSIGGSLLTVGCTTQATVIVASAATNMVCVMSGVAGNPANIQPQCAVTSAGVVTPQLCTAVAVTPTAQTYNIRVIQ